MNPQLFKQFCHLIHSTSGIALGDAKESLLIARISKRMRALNITTEQGYFDYLTDSKNKAEFTQFLDVISTNVTSFFREAEHFEALAATLQAWEMRGQSSFKIWCAASSSGEEPYTIALTAKEALKNPHANVSILATDISTKVLAQAIEGKYPADKASGLPIPIRNKYFHETTDGKQKFYEAHDELKRMILFKRLNLNNLPLPLNGPLDIIFCRNVMIYFDQNLKERLVENFFHLLKPGGLLFISLTESLAGIRNHFKMKWPAAFIKPFGISEKNHVTARE